jgi:hypothetical protein
VNAWQVLNAKTFQPASSWFRQAGGTILAEIVVYTTIVGNFVKKRAQERI